MKPSTAEKVVFVGCAGKIAYRNLGAEEKENELLRQIQMSMRLALALHWLTLFWSSCSFRT